MDSRNNKKNKRRGRNNGSEKNKKQTGQTEEKVDDMRFEDPFEDEFEKEDVSMAVDGNEDAEMADGDSKQVEKKVWMPGVNEMEDGEALEYDSTAYDTYHKLNVQWPCLSFDIMTDSLGAFRRKFPVTMYMAAGTQADKANNNKVHLLKISDLHRTKHDDGDGSEDDDDDDLDDDPIVEERSFKHPGGVNRLRCMPQAPHIIATMADTQEVHIWDAEQQFKALDKPPTSRLQPLKPVFTFSGHADEGYALDWSKVTPGRLLTGDCKKFVYLWERTNTSWTVAQAPYVGHTDSVEDIQWSPNESSVFATCSVDKTIRIWDTRVKAKCMVWVAAHKTDVNVISWNAKVSHLLASGADDGSMKIWDLRNFKSNSPTANFHWHKSPLTSLEWHPTDESVIACSAADISDPSLSQVSIWDMSLEPDEDPAVGADISHVDLPAQLLFVHQGQKNIKEVHWHPQVSSLLVSTALDGFNIFKPSNLGEIPGRGEEAKE